MMSSTYIVVINFILNLDIGFYSQIITVNNSPDIITLVWWVSLIMIKIQLIIEILVIKEENQ
jgi:hypothetical protein